MTNQQNQVRELMMAMGQACPDKPTVPSIEVRKLRIKLIAEELLELCDALGIVLEIVNGKAWIEPTALEPYCDLVAAADATTDLRVVVIGTDVAMGIDGEPCWDEINRSNRSKIPDNIGMTGGKWIKGPSYSPANLAPIIEGQKV